MGPGILGGWGPGDPPGIQFTGRHSCHRLLPQSPRGRHSLASKFAFPPVISPAASPSWRKPDVTAPAAAGRAGSLSHPLLQPRDAQETLPTYLQRPPPSPAHPPHTQRSYPPGPRPPRQGFAAITREAALHWVEGAGRASYPKLWHGFQLRTDRRLGRLLPCGAP